MEKQLNELNLGDDFLFAQIMSDKEICRKVLEKILNIQIKGIVPSSQQIIDVLLESKGIRLDIYVNDDEGTVYNCEMQRGKKRELPKRSRYYQGSIDLDLIKKGDPYEKLQKSFVVFICTFDPFREGRHLYTFQNTCMENPNLLLGDETAKVFLNTKGKMDDVDDEMKEFLSYVEDSTDSFVSHANSQLVREIHRKVTEVKQSKEMEVEYMTLLQRDRENIEQGIEKGKEQMAMLTKLLLKEGRIGDLEHASEDSEYRKELFEKYHIQS